VKAGKAKTRSNRPASRAKVSKVAKKAGATGRGKAKGKAVGRPGKKPMTNTKRSTKPALKLLPARKGRPAAPPPVVRVAVRELDPQRKCGEGTSVQFLYRVDETVDGRATAHLVFFDRHGWYCEHGRTCPAVAYAKKHNGRIARVS
jgi:hypothetical protein